MSISNLMFINRTNYNYDLQLDCAIRTGIYRFKRVVRTCVSFHETILLLFQSTDRSDSIDYRLQQRIASRC